MGVEIRGRGEGKEGVGFETAWRSREGRRGEEALSLSPSLSLSLSSSAARHVAANLY